MAMPNGSHANGNGANGSAYHTRDSFNSHKSHSSNFVIEEKPKGYYTVERSFYAQPPDSGTTVVVEKEKPKWNACLCLLVISFIILIIILIIVLVILFTVGGIGYYSRPDFEETNFRSTAQRFKAPSGHYDLRPPEWVDHALNNRRDFDVCLLDASPVANFQQGHIAGAQNFDINRVQTVVNGQRQPINPIQFQRYARSLGVTKYDEGDGQSSLEARFLFWLFHVYGQYKVSVMQGGLTAWRQQGLAVVRDPASQPVPGDFYAYWDPETFVLYEDLTAMLTAKPNILPQDQPFKIIDIRKQPDYALEHIPFAVNLPLDAIFDGKLVKSSVSDYDKILSQKGISREKVNIIYGDSSAAPATLYHALIQQGFNAKIYLGGFAEWQQRTQEAQPVITKP